MAKKKEPLNIDHGLIHRFYEVIQDLVGLGKKYRFTTAFAKANGMHPQNIVSIMKHQQMPSKGSCVLLMENEGINLNWLLGGRGERYLPELQKKQTTPRKTSKKAAKSKKARSRRG